MDCEEARELILESFAEPRPGQSPSDLDRHLSDCDNCRRFLESQRQLDWQLGRAIAAPPLNPGFRRSVLKKLRREPSHVWSPSLPDKAHWAGGIGATAISMWVLPFSAGSVVSAGLAFTLATYFVQCIIRGWLEIRDEGQQ